MRQLGLARKYTIYVHIFTIHPDELLHLLLVHEYTRHTHAGSHAHTRETDLLVPPLKLRQQSDNLSCAGGAQWMTDRTNHLLARRITKQGNDLHCTSTDVDLVDIQAEFVDAVNVL